MKYKLNYIINILIISNILAITSCKKLVEVKSPVTSITASSVFESDATAIAMVTGIYGKMSSGNLSSAGPASISLFTALSADELSLINQGNANYLSYYKNSLTNQNVLLVDFWYNIYPYIFMCNDAIEGLQKSTTLSPSVKQQLLGEAKFMRAFFYFYLVNLYGDVPLAISTDYTVNGALNRAPATEVYQRIVEDLKDAQQLLNHGYVKADIISTYPIASVEKIRPTKSAATALLARAYLYTGNWTSAESEASSVINNSIYSLSPISGANSAFTKNSSEAIWQLQPVITGRNTEDAFFFIIPSSGPSLTNPAQIDGALLNSFETGDQRRINWVGSVTPTPPGTTTYYYPYKYKSTLAAGAPSEYLMVLRLGEQYLIRAEARAKLNNISGAQSDLNAIRTRAGLGNTTAATQPTLLTAILQERRVELFTEWGHRWFDIKRTNTVDPIMTIASSSKGSIWNTNWQWYPIPLYDLQRNPNLIQNNGY